jgi:hypothetical protein
MLFSQVNKNLKGINKIQLVIKTEIAEKMIIYNKIKFLDRLINSHRIKRNKQ